MITGYYFYPNNGFSHVWISVITSPEITAVPVRMNSSIDLLKMLLDLYLPLAWKSTAHSIFPQFRRGVRQTGEKSPM